MPSVPTLLARVAAGRVERARAEAALAPRFAPRFNAVTLLGPGETRLSEVFRWMLDERDSHGQGRVFRDLFVATVLGDDAAAWSGARIACEVPTADGRGRIDLLLESSDGHRCVVIENKPWAGWQAAQLSRYLGDQQPRRAHVRVHALLGGGDPDGALTRHWAEGSDLPLPAGVTASGFDAVAAWVEACAAACRPEKVRAFLFDLADYCRRSILSEPAMTDSSDTADLILAGGDDALKAALAIAAAVPLAMTRDVARRVGGTVEQVVSNHVVRVTVDGVPLAFALFDVGAPWAGLTRGQKPALLRGPCTWGRSETAWPRWVYLKHIGAQGRQLVTAINNGDAEAIAATMSDVARVLIGTSDHP